ncbi:universal stress protein [Roseibium sp.]|uniref:universal stress protein n=1 Tax=Roseibium sp. TaxID=1936156 RepID=UPI0032982B4E
MSFKTILAVAEFTEDVKSRLQSAVDLARTQDAHLAVLLVGEVPSLPFYGYGGAGYTKVWMEEGEERVAALKALQEDVDAALAKEGISFDVRAHQAIVAREDNLVARHAIYSDLAVILRSGDGELNTVERQAIDGALFDSGRPLLFLPKPDVPQTVGQNILVAWNSRAEAAEALSDAMPFLLGADKVTLLLVDRVSGPDDHGKSPGADMALVLARHDVEVEVRQVSTNGSTIAEVLNREAKTLGADLIVMGARGHSRMRQTILGGTTREMLEETACPLFLAH